MNTPLTKISAQVTRTVAFFGVGTAFALSAFSAHATAFVVTTLIDEPFDGTETVAAPDNSGLSLREAIGLANLNAGAPEGEIDGDTITISPFLIMLPQTSTLTINSSITITDDLAIDGTLLSPLNYTIDAAGSDRIFIVDTALAPGLESTVALTQINLTRGATPGDGGGIQVLTRSDLLLGAGTVISECRAGDGGGVHNRGRTSLAGAQINRCVAGADAGSGGGIFNAEGASLLITESSFQGNIANRAGGAIEDQAGADLITMIEMTSFTSNNAGVAPANPAPGNGGAIHITGASGMMLTACTARENRAALEGGGYWNGTGSMMIEGGEITGNSASGADADDGGGGIFNNGGTLTVTGTLISSNVADGTAGSGGGVFSTAGDLVFDGDTVISANVANRAGGGIEVIEGTVLLDGILLGGADDATGNIAGPAATAAPGNGGGLHVSSKCEVTVNGGRVAFNVAAREGGGLWNHADATMTIQNGATISNNTASGPAADDGGGGIFNNGGTVVLDGTDNMVTVSDNHANGAAGSGGGILTAGGSLGINESTITRNVANRAGGGIEGRDLTFLTAISISRSVLSGNNAGVAPAATAAPGSGGGLHITGGVGGIVVAGSEVSENIAASEGGGIWNGTGSMLVEDSGIAGNIASGADASNGGGGIFNAGGTMLITGGSINENIADGTAGSGGGIFNDTGGMIELTGTTLNGNVANRAGGGIEDNAGASFVITESFFRGNIAGPDGSAAPGNGGAFHVTGAGTISFGVCDIGENRAANEGGGVWNSGAATMTLRDSLVHTNRAPDGAGVFQQAGSGILTITNATISGNGGTNGGGLQTEGGTTDLLHVTIANNSATTGGGVNVMAGTLNLANTVIADNEATTGIDLNGAIASANNSLLENAAGATGITNGISGNIVGADPQLAALANNGGGSNTHMPAVSSPLVNSGNNALAAALVNDQRGTGFVRLLGGTVDIGAVEVIVLTYAIWAEDAFTDATPLDQRGPNDNPDRDARSNAEEFLTGSDPENGSDGSPLQVDISSGELVIIYDRVRAIPAGVDALQNSTDLDTWMTSVGFTRTVSNQSPTLDQVTLSLPSAGNERLFGRLILTDL